MSPAPPSAVLRRCLVVRPALPLALVVVLLHVLFQRLFWLYFMALHTPNREFYANAGALTAYWEIWHGPYGWAGSLQRSFMIVNVLLALYVWACLRGLPRGGFVDRCQQLLAYGGAAMLLMYLQHALLKASLLEPSFRAIRVPLTPFP